MRIPLIQHHGVEMFRLDGKFILITGSTGHLGRQLAISLGELGAHVYVNARNYSNCKKLALAIKEKGGLATPVNFDVNDEGEVKDFANSIDLLDILINNAYSGKGGTIEFSETKDYISSYTSTVTSSANLFKTLLPKLRNAVCKNGGASVINIASLYGLISPDLRVYDSIEESNPPFYGSGKAALIQWTKYAACEFAKENIRVNCITPGIFPSGNTQIKNPLMVQKLISKIPMQRIGQPIDLVGPVVFLASSCSSYVTGTNILVDGGRMAW